ncbi:MAG TPA: aspartyl protease family protein, partial [Ardenticatenaceae bacterium]|nr:aspartyl protease family protein [Ardenticatenaceae bacterium]
DSADFSGATAAFERAIAADPTDASALHGLGRLHLSANEVPPALILLEQAATLLVPEDNSAGTQALDVRRDLAWAYYRVGRYDLAAPVFASLPGHQPFARLLAAFGDRSGYLLPSDFAGVEIPLAATDPVPFVEVEVGSGSYLFVVDTGAGDVVLDTGLARQLELPFFGEREVTLAGGSRGVIGHARLPRLRIGSLEVRDLPVEVADVRRVAPQLHGFIGTNFLARFQATFDLANGRLLLRPRDSDYHPSGEVDSAGFRLFDDHVLLAPGSLEGYATIFAVASGIAGAAVVVPQSSMRQAGLERALRPGEAIAGVGPGGSHQLLPFTASELRLGSATRQDVEGLAGPFYPDLEWRYGFRVGGVVAHDFLRGFRWTIDWTRMRLWFEPATGGARDQSTPDSDLS